VFGAAPAPSPAGECDGMSNYQYDHGQCTDMTGDMLGVMERSGDESYRMDQQRLQRGRQPLGGGLGAAAGGTNAQIAKYLVDLTSFQRDPSFPSAALAAQWLAPPNVRGEMARYFQRMLDDYVSYAPQHGFALNSIPDALFFALQAAYIVYDGERIDPSFDGQTQLLLMKSIAAKPAIASMTDQTKQAASDQFGILGVAMLVEADRAQRAHNSKDLRDTRSFAARFIKTYGGIDPATTKINQLVCLALPGPCEQTQFLLSGGRLGRLQFPSMIRR
ncbi:MAG: DUF6683 family protein, partial [Candidatus Baltobacteraceae bacterium]